MSNDRDKDIDLLFSREIVLISKEMGWTIDYTLNLGISQYFVVKETINFVYESQRREMEIQKIRQNFG